jgi:hypothetical protein
MTHPHSRTLASIDLRLTRPPETLRPVESERPRTQEGDVPQDLPEKSKRKKPKNKHQKKEADALFEDLSPEAQRRLNAMLRNFCTEANGALKPDIDLEQYAVDAGEVITNATIQELCLVQPNLVSLNLKGCGLITDVALLTIARHCPSIKHLILSGCDKITNIGLRSLSMRCSELVTLDFTDCLLLDDLGLSTIACGCWKLEKLILVNCTGVTDTGVGKVVKACGHLKILNLHGCCRVGEFGDHALKEIGAFCPNLVYLDLVGCRHVHNDGLTALAQGCQNLDTLLLSGCDGVNGQGILALCKYASNLRTLMLRGCESLRDVDVNVFRHAAFAGSLTSIDLSDCKCISNMGVAAICSALGSSLRSLNISGCKISDHVCDAICARCEKLNSLDISRCKTLTDKTVHTLVSGISGLTTLKLDGNQKISSRTLIAYSSGPQRLEFANISQQWFGFEPKKDAENLILLKERNRVLTAMALKIQCMIRRKIAYRVYREKRRIWIVNRAIPKFQALYRGVVVRRRYLEYKRGKMRHAMATRIQRNFKRYLEVVKRYRMFRATRIHGMKVASAKLIQRMYWGLKGRKRAIERRNEIANERLEIARVQAVKESQAIVIQCAWHICRARMRTRELKEIIRQRRIVEARKQRMALIIQRVERGRKGRKKAKYVRWLKRKKAMMWRMSREIQRVYRGHVGRLIAARERELRWLRIINQKATILQCFWRTMRAKMIVAILRALKILRAKQYHNAREIQRVFRGMQVRIKMDKLRADMSDKILRILSVIKIQKIFRGHKGREIAEVERALKASEEQARPLYGLLRELEEDGIKETKNSNRLEGLISRTEHEIKEIIRELDQATRTTSKFTDSNRVNGIPQRFLTKYLIVRLNDSLNNEQVDHTAFDPLVSLT